MPHSNLISQSATGGVHIEPYRLVKREAIWFDKIEPMKNAADKAKDEPLHSLAQYTPMCKVYDR
jgi:hypothetical protein